ncbi:hypothetical protein G3260_006755 [Streptomyces albus]|nr:hypothetical protein G3260_006755 [Streptomyces albus]
MLNEGVDMPAVDAVVFADPRYSVIDAIQAIGRALRQPPGSGKIATLVIPVYLPDKTSPGKLLKNSSFGALWSILQALRAHDDSYLDRIALPERRPGGRVLGRRLHYSQPERAAELAAALGLQITLPQPAPGRRPCAPQPATPPSTGIWTCRRPSSTTRASPWGSGSSTSACATSWAASHPPRYAR